MIRPVTPGQSNIQRTPEIAVQSLTPGVSSLLSEVLQQLLPITAQVLRDHVAECGGDAHPRPGVVSWELLQQHHDVTALDGYYANALAEYALKRYDQRDLKDVEFTTDQSRSFHQTWATKLESDLTSIGSGSVGPYNSSPDDLHDGPLRVHREIDPHERTIRISLDAEAWSDPTDMRTAEATLRAIDTLSEAFEVQLLLASPRLVQALDRQYGDILEELFDLTDGAIPSRGSAPDETAEPPTAEDPQQWAYDALTTWSEGDGHYRMLAHLPTDETAWRQQRVLADDPDIDLDTNSVSAYASRLEDRDLVRSEHTSQGYKRLQVTDIGRAAQDLIADDYTLRAPEQTQLSSLCADLTGTPHSSASTVYASPQGREGGRHGLSRDSVLVETGTPDEGADYVQWLPGIDQIVDRAGLHRSIIAGKRGDGITLVDDRIDEFDDGRVSYMSLFDDEVLIASQWGGSLPTLGRIVSTLLDPRLISKALGPDTVGSEFQDLHDGAITECDPDVDDVIRFGHQIGWFSDDEQEWAGWKDRYLALRGYILEEVAECTQSDDKDRRGELYRDLLGLLTSMTHLYHAAGLEVTINVRIPDTGMLVGNERRRDDFLTWIAKTVTKQTIYKIHSGYRMVLEERPEKLKRRLSYVDDIDLASPAMETTADFLISGPTVTELQDEIEAAIRGENEAVRESIANGTESAAVMQIPVQNGNSRAAIEDLLRDRTRAKGYVIDSYDGDELRELLRLLYRALAGGVHPSQINPHDVSEVFERIAKSSRAYDPLTLEDLQHGLSKLPATRLLPDLKPATTKILKVLLAADEPLGRSEIVERAGISGSRYYQRIATLSTLDIVQKREIEGQTRWTGTLTPWWLPASRQSTPEDRVNLSLQGEVFERDLVAELVFELEIDVDHELLCWPYDTLDAVYRESPQLQRWRGFIKISASNCELLTESAEERSVVIGLHPAASDELQADLNEVGDYDVGSGIQVTADSWESPESVV